jgi:hypothetical protein
LFLERAFLEKQASWQVTATTVNCDAVDDEVTILVYKDWTAKCTAHPKYTSPRGEGILKRKSLLLKRQLRCLGPECSRVSEYRQKLLSEESDGKGKA